MNSGATANKVRLVRCPKCREILMELPDIPVYDCGSCGTRLQAKIRKNNSESTASGLHETDAVQKSRLDKVSIDRESSCSNLEETFYSPKECSSSQSNGRNPTVPGNCNGEHLTEVIIPNEHQSNGHDPNESPGIDNGYLGDANMSNEDQTNGSDKNEPGDCVNQKFEVEGLPNEDQKKGSCENEFSDRDGEQLELARDDQIQQNVSGDCSNELLGGANLSKEVQKEKADQNECSDCNFEETRISNEVCSPSRLSGPKNEEVLPLAVAKSEVEVSVESSPSAGAKVELETNNESDGISDEKADQNECSDCNFEETRVSNEVCSPSRLSGPKNEEALPLAGAKSEVEVSVESSPSAGAKVELDAKNESDGISDEGCSHTELFHPENEGLPALAGAKSEVVVTVENSPFAGAKAEPDVYNESNGISDEVDSPSKPGPIGNATLTTIAAAQSEVGVSDGSSPAKEKAELDAKNESDSNSRRPRTEKSVDMKQFTSIVTAHRPAGESISSDILVSSPNEQLEQPRKSIHKGFDGIRCTDTFETTDFANPSSELSGTLIDLSKSPTTRSSRSYYDDYASSYEGTDDQLPDRHKHPFRYAYKPVNYTVPEERSRREKFLVNSSSEMLHQSRNYTSITSDKKRQVAHVLKSSKFDRDEVVEHRRPGYPVRNWRRLEQDEYLSQLTFYERGSLAGYESGSPSNRLRHEFQCNSSLYSHDMPSGTDQEKMKLLRMIYELQDQVNKACFLNENANGRVDPGVTLKDHHVPTHRNHVPLEEASFDNFHYLIHRHPGRFREGSNQPQHSKHSRIPFSAEAASSRNQVDCSFCCCPQDWRPTQLRPLAFHHNNVFCKVHKRVNSYNSHGSCPSSPLRQLDSEFAMYRHGVQSDDQRHRDQKVKKFLREKHHVGKQHLRPIAGGAPFITCSRCFKQLQLPAEFLLFKKRCHRLKCGACSEVLKFSLTSRTHLVPYTPTVDTPPPIVVDEYGDASCGGNLAQTSHASDPVSCSEDYGLPFCKSCSTDGDPVYRTSSHAVHGNTVGRNASCDSIKQREERRKFILNERQNKYKNHVEEHDLSGPSSSMSKSKKVSSEIEEELPRRAGNSPLHRLMGYASPSRLVYGYGPPCSGTSSRYPAED